MLIDRPPRRVRSAFSVPQVGHRSRRRLSGKGRKALGTAHRGHRQCRLCARVLEEAPAAPAMDRPAGRSAIHLTARDSDGQTRTATTTVYVGLPPYLPVMRVNR